MAKKTDWWHSKEFRTIVRTIVLYLIISLVGILFLFPFIWVVSTSLKKITQIFVFPPQWIPKPIMWSNYVKAMTIVPFHIFFKNTIIVTFSSIIGALLSSSIVAYGFARLRFPGRNVLFLLLLSTMMIPWQVIIVPLFILFKSINWISTLKPLIVPSFFASNAFFVFLLRQFFATIPMELDDAARIDGCGRFQIYYKIILPLSKPAMATIVIFAFILNWNNFIGPLIFLTDPAKYTVSLGLALLRSNTFGTTNLIMAASTVAILPCLIIFFFAQKLFIQGITLTGLKG